MRGAAPRWLAPVAAAVAVLLVGGLAWALLLRPDARNPVTVATETATAPATPTPSAPESTQPQATRSESATSAPAGTQALPVYYVGTGSTANPWLLYRTFLPDQRVGADPSALANKAVSIALAGRDDNGHSLTAYEGSLQPWRPGTTATTSLGPDEIRVVLAAGRGAPGSPRTSNASGCSSWCGPPRPPPARTSRFGSRLPPVRRSSRACLAGSTRDRPRRTRTLHRSGSPNQAAT